MNLNLNLLDLKKFMFKFMCKFKYSEYHAFIYSNA